MYPSIFSLGQPVEAYDILYGIFIYTLGIGLAFSWAALAFMDMAENKAARSVIWGFVVLVLPIIGAAGYLLTAVDTARRRPLRIIIISGLLLWAIALAYGLPKIWGPLGPKAL